MLTRRFMVLATVVALGIGLTFQLQAQRPGLRPTVFAIRDARIVLEPGKDLARGTVVIRDGLIQSVGENISIPGDALVIEGHGLTVYPGFIDAGSTWGIDLTLRRSEAGPPEPVDYASEALAATKADNRKGVTPEFVASTALRVEEETADNWRRQGFTARLAVPDSGILAGQSALVSLSGTAPREAVLRAPVAMHAGTRATGSGYPGTLMGSIAHLRQTLLDAGHYARLTGAHEKQGIGRRPPLDPALLALRSLLSKQQPVIFEADTKDSIHRALDLCEEFNLQPIILGGEEAWKVADRLQAAQVPVILRINFPDQPGAAGGRRGFGGRRGQPPTPTPADPGTPSRRGSRGQQAPPTPPPAAPAQPGAGPGAQEPPPPTPKRVRDDQERRLKEEIRNAAALQQKGIRFAFSGTGLDRPERFRENLRKAIAEGLAPEAALRALTTDAARILGAEKLIGTITPGKAAHLVVMTGDFQDARSQVRHVFADGVQFEFEATQQPAARPEARRPEDKPESQAKEAAKIAEQASELEEDRKPKLRTGGNVLLKGGVILTVTNGTLKGDILVQGGKIARVGQNLDAPMGVAILDAEGLYIMPGIIDTHCHFAMGGGVNEGTLSIVPEVRVRDIINSEDVQIYRALAGGVTTGRLLHGSANVTGGQDAVIKLKYGEPAHRLLVQDAPRGVKFALGENVKRTDGRFPNTRLGVEAVLVRAFTEAQAYKQTWEEYRKTQAARQPVPEPRRDLRLEALADILDGKLQMHCHCYRADEILMLLRVADRFGFKVKSLQHVLEGYKIAPEIAAHGASNSTFSDWWAYKIEAYDAIPYNAALLHEAGALVCLKSDSSELMRHLYQEAAKVMKYGGMSETDALKTITLNAAKQLGLDKRIGSIEEGKDADLAIFNAHPLNSYARCEMTLVEGELYFQRPNGPGRLAYPVLDLNRGPRGPGVIVKSIARDPQGKYVLRGATVHPVTGSPLEGATVVIEGGKVTAVAGQPLPTPANATLVDAQGLHIYPGMIDAGTVLGLTELGSARETQDHSEGGDFQPDLRAATGINSDSELIPVTRANGVLTVVTRPTGGIIAGQSALINLSGWVPSEMVVVEPLALQIEFPAAVPLFTGDPTAPSVGRAIARRQRDERIRRVKELFKQALAYAEARKAGGVARPIDPRLEALVPYARGAKPVIIQANRQADIREALKLAEDLKIKMILSGGIDAWKVADELKKRDIPVILGPVMVMPQESYDPYDTPFACAAKLHEAGVKFCIRSAGSTNTRNLPYEAAMAVSYGLPPEEGLKAVTLYPAQILGVADRLGSIESGKMANLVLTDGDILQATTQVQALFINGNPVEPSSKHTRLYERYRQRLQEVREGKAQLGTN
jgi:imidazolonepropionase-like amidohydrolase